MRRVLVLAGLLGAVLFPLPVLAAITHVGTDSAGHTTTAANSFSPTVAQTPTSGDVLILFLGTPNEGSTLTVTPPTGWTVFNPYNTTKRYLAMSCTVGTNCNSTSLGSFSMSASQVATWYVTEFSGLNTAAPFTSPTTQNTGSCASGVSSCTVSAPASAPSNGWQFAFFFSTDSTATVSSVTSYTIGASVTTTPQGYGAYFGVTSSPNTAKANFSTTSAATWYGVTYILAPGATGSSSNIPLMGCCKK